MGGGERSHCELYSVWHVNEQSRANMANQEIILDTIRASVLSRGGTDIGSIHEAHLQNIFRISAF